MRRGSHDVAAPDARRLIDGRDARQRLRRAVSFDGDPARLPLVLTNALVVGFLLMAGIGVVNFAATRSIIQAIQPIVAVALTAWAVAMIRRNDPRPALLLGVTITASFGYLVVVALDPTPGEIAGTSPVAIIVGGGVIALVAGGREALAVGIYALVLAALAAVVVQMGIGSDAITIAVDAGNTLVVMGVAFAMVRAIRKAVEDAYTRYQALVESAPVAVAEVDLAGYLRGDDPIHLGPMNAMASAVLGYTDSRKESNVARHHIPAELADVLAMAAAAPTGTGVRTMADGRTFKVGWQVDPSSGSVTLTGTDITAQRRAEVELSGQVSGRDRFIATVSHELRTPLTGAMGLLEIVSSGGADDSERDEMIELALLQVKDMADIVEDLLVAARAANGRLTVNPEVTDVAASVANVLSVTGEPFAADFEPHALAWADPVRLRQIVKNLVTNAIRYGGAERQVAVFRTGQLVVVEVKDTGPPLDPEKVELMFEPYERADGQSHRESVGLGLTVARTLARLMGGDVTYEHDGLATFRLVLPAAPEEPQTASS